MPIDIEGCIAKMRTAVPKDIGLRDEIVHPPLKSNLIKATETAGTLEYARDGKVHRVEIRHQGGDSFTVWSFHRLYNNNEFTKNAIDTDFAGLERAIRRACQDN